jgi:hypothetical protein
MTTMSTTMTSRRNTTGITVPSTMASVLIESEESLRSQYWPEHSQTQELGKSSSKGKGDCITSLRTPSPSCRADARAGEAVSVATTQLDLTWSYAGPTRRVGGSDLAHVESRHGPFGKASAIHLQS